jgi:Tfp pilus assembly protein PilF
MAQAFDEDIKLAASLLTSGRLPEAAAAFAKLTRIAPSNPHAHGNLGVALSRMGKFDAAAACYRRALTYASNNPAILANLGATLRMQGKIDDAVMLLSRASLLAHNDPMIALSAAVTLREAHRPKNAQGILQRLQSKQPQNSDYELALALTELQLGHYPDGFRHFEARRRLPRAQKTPWRDGPRWTGDDPANRRVLVQVEPGFRNAIQFGRFVPVLAKRGARIIVECMPELADLFATLEGVEQVIALGDPAAAFDVTVPLLSLPHLLGTTWEDLPAGPYLTAPNNPLLEVSGEFAMRVGLVWAGAPSTPDRSWPLMRLVPLLEDPTIAFFSLQTGPPANQLAALGLDHVVIDLSPRLKSFADTAAAISQLDLIISVDAAAAHLAAAMGQPTWVLLRYAADWRWPDNRTGSPWYPAVRLFRQLKSDDFTGTIVSVRNELERLARGQSESAA